MSKTVNDLALYQFIVGALILFSIKLVETYINPAWHPITTGLYYAVAGLAAFFIWTLGWRVHDNINQPKRVAASRAGYVYLISSDNIMYKIGHTVALRSRIGTIKNASPYDPTIICVIHSTDRFALEKALHTRFAARHFRREWFKLTPADVAYIKSLTIEKKRIECPFCGWSGEYETDRGATNAYNAHLRHCTKR